MATVALLPATPGDTIADLPARLAGLKAVGDVVNKHLDSLVEFAKAGDTSAAEDLNAAVALSQLVESRIKEVTSATARAQEFQKVPRDSWLARIDPVEYEQTIGRMNAEMLPEQTAQILSGLKEKYGADTANSWASNWVTAAKNGGKIAWELFTNSLLSGPKTIAKKFLSDLATTLYAIPQRAIMRANHVLFFSKDPLGTQEGEASALAYGLGKGIVNTVRLASEGKEFPGVATWTHEPALTAANVGVNPDTFLGRGIDKWVGPAIRTPGRTIEQLTNIAQTVDYQMELGAQAIRQARIELGPFEDSETYADRFADRVQYIQDHPAEFPAVDAGARDAAIRMTYTQELGSAGKAFQSWVDQVPGLRASMPFLRIPINLGKRMTHFFPPTWGVSALFGEMNRQLKMGGAAREAALADLQAGVIGSAAVAFLVTSGHITGGGPTDKALKERWLATGRREYSFYPNGMADDGSTGYSYHNLLPWGGTIGLIADLAEIHAQLPEDSPWYERSLQIGTAIALSTSKSFKDEPMMLGLSRTLNALVAPDKEANHFTEGWAQSLVPALVRQFNHVYLDNAVKEIRGPLDALRAAVYGPSVVDRRDPITGDKILFPPGLGPDMVSPISISTIKGDPVAQELLDQRVKVSRLPWVIDGSTAPHLRMEEPTIKEGIPLTPEQRDSWIDYMTQEPLFNGRTLQEALQKKIDSPSYQKLSGWPESDRREMELRQIISAYREKARVSMLREDWDLNLDLIENERQRNQARKTGMLPGETTPSPAPVDTRPPTPAPGPAPQPVTGSMVTPSSPMTTQPSPQLEVGR